MSRPGYDISAHDWATLTGEPHVVAGRVGVVVATESDIARLDSKVRQLETATDAPGQMVKLDFGLSLDWVTFRGDWAKFFGDSSSGALAIPFIVQQDVTDQFTEFVGRYNELLRRIVAAGVVTTATPSGATGGDPSLLERFGDFLGVSRAAAPFVAAGTAVVGGVIAYEIVQHLGRGKGRR